jgi:hypothetical protein
MLDANAQADDESDALYKLLNATTLVDAFPIFSGTPCSIPTYARGRKRLDCILTSGYLAFYKINDSDHRGLFMDLDEQILDNKVELVHPPQRQIVYSSPAEVIYKFKQQVHHEFLEHNIYSRSKNLAQ